MPTVPVSLKDDDQKFIEEVVKSGRYFSESEVVAEALSELRMREAIRRRPERTIARHLRWHPKFLYFLLKNRLLGQK